MSDSDKAAPPAAKPSRPSPPAAVARQLRQEAGFGCCFCGVPFVEYHHIVPWAVEHHFRPADMMVACATHHGLCGGAINEAAQRAAKVAPRNLALGLARGPLYVNAPEMRVRIGGALLIDTPIVLALDGKPIVSVRRSTEEEGGGLLVTASIHDRDGNEIGRLEDNEWKVKTADTWDFECKGQLASIRNALRDVAFSIDVRDDAQIVLRGKWWFGGKLVEFGPDSITIAGNYQVTNSTFERCAMGINLKTGAPPKKEPLKIWDFLQYAHLKPDEKK